MKMNKTLTALVTGASLGLAGQAFAAGTTSGTSVSNTTSLDYTVSSVAQTTETVEAAFLVDTRVDFNLTRVDTATIKVTPDGSGYVFEYTLANTSNEVLDFNLSTANLTTGLQSVFGTDDINDNFDVTTTAYVESGANAGYLAAEDTATSVDDLAVFVNAGDEVTVYVVTSTIPDTQDDGDAAAVALSATARLSTGAAIPAHDGVAFDQATKQYVLADADRDGVETTNGAFEVSTAEFTDPLDDTQPFRMDVVVINDPVCDNSLVSTQSDDHTGGTTCPDVAGTYYPKAIPGAMVKYTIHAKNTGSIKADNVTFSENIATADNTDPNYQIELVDNSVDNIAGTTTGAGVISTAASDGANGIVNVNFTEVEVDATVTVTFTAIVE